MDPKVYYFSQKHLPPVPILSEICPVHVSPSDFLNTCFNIIIPSMPSSSQWSVLLTSSHQNPVCNSPDPNMCHMPLPSHSFWFNHPSDSWWRAQIIKLLVLLSFHPPVILSLLGPYIFVSTLFSAYVPTSMWETKFHTHTKQQTKVLSCIL